MLTLPLYYLAPVSYYSRIYRAMAEGDTFTFNTDDRWEKQTLRSRCYIAGPQGRMMLTVPVKKAPSNSPFGGESQPERNNMEAALSAALPQRGSGKGALRTTEILLSDHGNWRHQHWNALVSSYRQSAFFDYYADAFKPHYEAGRYDTLWQFNMALHRVVMDALELENVVEIAKKRDETAYYQVFASRTGFLPDLSIVDLLFNMGPEARLYL